MLTHRRFTHRSRFARPTTGLLVGLGLCGLAGGSALRAGESPPATALMTTHHHHDRPMTDADMQRWVGDWYAAHPRRGANASGVPAATFTVFSFGFDADGNTADVDTVHVLAGDIVQWTWVDGFHTTTNGMNALDPNAGLLFDQPIDFQSTEFSFQFMTPGLVPFFCRPHENLMFGYVDVQAPTDVVPIDGRGVALGFTGGPTPNPTIDTSTFRFAVGGGGGVRVDVFDVRGRRVATAVDRVLAAGAYAASWNGRTEDGERAPAGVYFLRLIAPGIRDSREVVVAR